MKTFEELLIYLGGVKNISQGGCGVAASFIYLWLRRNSPHSKPQIVYKYSWNFKNNAKILKAGCKEPLEGCQHVIVRWKGKYWDSDGEYFTRNNNWERHEIPFIYVQKSLVREGNWNVTFDRRKIKKMEKDIKICLSLEKYIL